MNDSSKRSAFLSPKMFGAGVLVIMLIAFWSQNRDRVKVDFVLFDSTVRLWVALLTSSVFGMAVGYLGGRRRD